MEFKRKRYCPNCGERIRKATRYCPHCFKFSLPWKDYLAITIIAMLLLLLLLKYAGVI